MKFQNFIEWSEEILRKIRNFQNIYYTKDHSHTFVSVSTLLRVLYSI